jgi:hypothetical protein
MTNKVVYEEDIEAAHKLAERLLGPNGNIEYPTPRQPNIRVTSAQHGILWYGDLGKRQMDGLVDLSIKLGDIELTIESED